MRRSGKLVDVVWLVCLFGVLPSGYAAETNTTLVFTNRSVVDFPEAALSLRPIERYEQELIRNQGVVADRFGPPSYLDWTRFYSREGYRIHDHFNSLGANAVGHLIGDSMRETAVAILPLEEWRGFGQLLLGSIGNTAEERTRTISASFSETEESWRQDVYRDGVLQYGVRPWRRDPYGYVRVRVGHWGGMENLPLFAFEGRVGYKVLGSSKLEGRLIVPLPHNFQLAGGIATDPMRLGSRIDSPTVMSARLEYVLNKSRGSKVMYVGVQSGSHETFLATGFLLAW